MKLNKITSLLLIGMVLTFAAMASSASAQRRTSVVGKNCEKILRGVTIVYFPSRSLAADMYNAHLRQGDCAKMWNAGSKGWALQIKEIPGAGSRSGKVETQTKIVTATPKPATDGSATSGGNANKTAVGEGCTEILRNVTPLYFPTREMAVDMYNAHLRQGDCAKFWDAGSKGWALQIKAMINSRSRRGKINR